MSRNTRDQEGRARHAACQTLYSVACSAYVLAFFAHIPRSWNEPLSDGIQEIKQWAMQRVAWGFDSAGIETLSSQFLSGAYIVVLALVVPWAFMLAIGRGRPSTLGFRVPSLIGWRLLAIGYVVATPFLVWMVRSPQFADQYMPQLRAGIAGFLGYNTANMIAEHFLFQGVLLAALRANRRWPEPVAAQHIDGGELTTALRWIGMASATQDTRGFERMTRWLGLADGCVFPVLVAGLLFGAVHVGKDPRELLLSIPGGIVQSYIAYRANSWLIPLLLRLATAGTACLLMVLTQPA